MSQKKRGDNVSLKGEKTKQDIREKAYQLFVEKGFKEVTMKDICELTGLSLEDYTAIMKAQARYFWK